ncbi:MAG: hypothetical protein CYG60_26015 [Actinobacteria bacterium]|nr:MAG: hypothetical protein CYG60_26015 [Actinomycetota bacterium]
MAAPDLAVWAKYLARRIVNTPTDYQGHEDVPEDAALALVEALEPGDLDRLTDALLEAAPGFAERVADAVLGDLKEDIARKMETGEFGGSPVELIEQIQAKWEREA